MAPSREYGVSLLDVVKSRSPLPSTMIIMTSSLHERLHSQSKTAYRLQLAVAHPAYDRTSNDDDLRGAVKRMFFPILSLFLMLDLLDASLLFCEVSSHTTAPQMTPPHHIASSGAFLGVVHHPGSVRSGHQLAPLIRGEGIRVGF